MSEIYWLKQLENEANNNLGQNFLIDSNISRKITKLVQGQLGDPILEIGPGTGSLTNELLKDDDIDTIIITTRHDSHAKIVVESLNANKNIFIEKPLALNQGELDQIITAYKKAKNPSLIVGFNRRFSPHIQSIKKSIHSNTPINIIATMNAGFIPKEHWVHDMEIGGGRIIGEACHYMDLCNYLTGSKIKSVCISGKKSR